VPPWTHRVIEIIPRRFEIAQRNGGHYHSGAVVQRMKSYDVRSYIPEKRQKGRRNWEGKAEQQHAVYQNRRRVRSEYGKSLLRRRGELVERSFAHCYETGGLGRCHLRGRENILKRQLVHVGAFNLSLVLRKLMGAGTPRELKNRAANLVLRLCLWIAGQLSLERALEPGSAAAAAAPAVKRPIKLHTQQCRNQAHCTTGC